MNFRMLIYHAESEALFECFDEKEATGHLDYGLCDDVTGIPKFETRFKEEQRMSKPNSAAAARAAAIARTKQKAKEGQNRFAGKSCIKTDIKPLEKKDGAITRVSVLCYTVTEKHHPDGIKPGEKWWRRPYDKHRQIGVGDEARDIVCPRSFNPRAACSPCEDASELRKGGKWEDIKDALNKVDKQRRWILLVWDHDAKELRYMDESYGGKKNPAFGLLMDSRLSNPRQEDWAGFWLDDDLGYALDITWMEAEFGGNKFFKATAIDFVERKKAPLPKDVYSKVFDLSDMLVKTSSEEVEKLHLQLPDEEAQDPDGDPNAGGTSSTSEKEDEETPTEEEEETLPFSKTFDEMNKEELLEHSKLNQLKDSNDKLIYRFHARKTEDEIRALVKEAEGQTTPEESGDDAGGKCEFYGSSEHFGTRDECAKCPDDIYNACGDAADGK